MSWVHDNIILSYHVDFENEVLAMKTHYTYYNDSKAPENTDVIFTGYLTHDFSNAMRRSIIFDIEKYPLDRFLEEARELLEERKNYWWPIKYKNEKELVEYLQANQYKVFSIYASIGLGGYVFAKQKDIIVNGRPVVDGQLLEYEE